jgi:hypothetical protein
MSKISALLGNYNKYIAVPWRKDTAPAQRVIFCVYNETDERALRVQMDEFEIVTKNAGHEWVRFDLTDTFAVWLASLKYAESYYKQPEKLEDVFPEYLKWLTNRFKTFVEDNDIKDDHVVALCGIGSLYGFLKTREVVVAFAPVVTGKLLVFFPGSFDNNNYRLLDSHDGWNYLAVPITAEKG